MLSLITGLIEEQPALSSSVLKKLAHQDGMTEAAALRLIRQPIKRVSRGGFVDWDDTDSAVEGAIEVQNYLAGLDSLQHAEHIIGLNLLVIDECSELLEIADDSSGFIGDVIEESLGMIQEAVVEGFEDADDATIERIYNLFYSHILQHVDLDITNVPEGLMEALLHWPGQSRRDKKLFDYIEKLLNSDTMKSQSYDYYTELLRSYQLSILDEAGEEQVIEAFIEEYLHYSAIRKAAVQRAINGEKYLKAVELCKKAEQADSPYPGDLRHYRALRFKAHEGAGQFADMADLAYTFASEGDADYYQKLKGLTVPEEWPQTVQSLLADLSKGAYLPSLYTQIMIDENMTEDLLQHCRKNVREIKELYPHLIGDYPNKVNELFTAFIFREVEHSSNRKHYRAACREIESFRKALGAEAANALIEELKFLYPKRRALLDELDNVKISK